LALLLIALLLMVYMLTDNGADLGLPIAANNDIDRAALLDNAKFVLVTMVILHHTSLYKNFGLSREMLAEPWGRLLFNMVCPLHTRTLCFISGILSRSEFKAEKVMIGLVGPLFGFCFIIDPAKRLMERRFFGVLPSMYDNPLQSLFNSEGQLQWYLVALIWWRVLGSLIASFRPCVRILAAYVLAAMVTYVATGFLSLPAIGLFPSFVAGQLFPYDQALAKLPWRSSTAVIGLLMLVIVSIGRTFVDAADLVLVPSPIHFPRSFSNDIANPVDMPLFWLRGLADTSLEIFKSIVFLFLVCPRKKTCFTDAGKYSIYSYLLHPFVLPWLGKAVVLTPWLKDRTAISLPLKVIVAAVDILICGGVCAMLASRPVRFVFSLLIEPTWIRNFYIKDRGNDKSGPTIGDNTEREQSK